MPRADEQEADIRLDQIGVQQWSDPSLLDDIYSAIESGEMPPEDAPKHPEPNQSKAIQKVSGQSASRSRRKAEAGNAETIESSRISKHGKRCLWH